MNLLKNISLGIFLSLLIFTGCKKDDSDLKGSAAEGTIQASVSGKSFKSSAIPGATFATKTSVGSLTVINMTGSTAGTSSQSITINLNGITEPGTYQIGGSLNASVIITYMETEISLSDPTNPKITTWTAPWDGSVAGEITITELTDTKITGTFTATCKDEDETSTKELKSGSFNLKFMTVT